MSSIEPYHVHVRYPFRFGPTAASVCDDALGDSFPKRYVELVLPLCCCSVVHMCFELNVHAPGISVDLHGSAVIDVVLRGTMCGCPISHFVTQRNSFLSYWPHQFERLHDAAVPFDLNLKRYSKKTIPPSFIIHFPFVFPAICSTHFLCCLCADKCYSIRCLNVSTMNSLVS